jgi:hypothetical protein
VAHICLRRSASRLAGRGGRSHGEAESGGGAEAYEILAASYLVQKDCKNGIGPLEKSVDGREPTECRAID